MRHLVLSALVAAARSGSLGQQGFVRHERVLRLRGGQEGGGDSQKVLAQCIERLNQFPTFCVVNADGNVVGVPNDAGGYDVTWYVELEQAKEMLELMIASSEDGAASSLELGCTPLGNAYLICAGLTEHKSEDGGPQYNIKGTRAVLEGQETGTGDPVSILRSQLKQRGLEDESSARWMLPIFMHDDFQTDSMMPIFFSPSELTRGWIASGRPVDEAPEQPLMMDIRMLMLAMQQDSALRAKAQLVPTQEAYEAAKQIQAAVQEGE